MKMIKKEHYGKFHNNEISVYTLTNRNGVSLSVTDFGATVLSLLVPDRQGNLADVVLGYDRLEGYSEENGEFIGCVVAPNGNRIARGTFELNGVRYHLDINNGVNNLHTHFELGAAKKVMDVQMKEDEIVFRCCFGDMEAGLPGNRMFSVSYRLDDENRLIITYAMNSDKDTIFNPTQHSYFNMAGHDSGSILTQQLQLDCDCFTPVDETLIPTGELRPVEGTPFDFRQIKEIGRDMDLSDEQLGFGKGYDHNFVINGYDGTLRYFGLLRDPASGREMHCYTTQPGVQVYTGNYLERADGKQGMKYHPNYGVCLETQYFPDTVNHPDFPQADMKAGQTVTYQTVYEFRW
ncbi:MAG: galactose mutarotase [Erysipelotrichaceae bacterium]|nr:galactose mutarotase [Erysipelotrichaceae bacterium]